MIRKYLCLVAAIFLVVIIGFITYTSYFMEAPVKKTVTIEAIDNVPHFSQDEGMAKMMEIILRKHSPNQAFHYDHVEDAVTTLFEEERLAFKVRNGLFIIQRVDHGVQISKVINPKDEATSRDYFSGPIPPTENIHLSFPRSADPLRKPVAHIPNSSKLPDDLWFRRVMEYLRMYLY